MARWLPSGPWRRGRGPWSTDAVSGDDFARARREGCTRVTSRRRPLYHYICTSWRRRSTTCSMRWMVRRLTCWHALLSGLVSRRLVGLCAPGPGGADMRNPGASRWIRTCTPNGACSATIHTTTKSASSSFGIRARSAAVVLFGISLWEGSQLANARTRPPSHNQLSYQPSHVGGF